MDDEKKRLLEIIRKLSYEKRKVILRSGRESDFYIDFRQTALNPEGSYLTGRVVFNKIKELGLKVQGIAGPTLGADPIVTSVSMISYFEGAPIPALIIRKEAKSHGTAMMIEGLKNVKKGDEILVVEDVLTTGGSVLRSIEILREEGLNPVHVIVLVDRDEGGKKEVEEKSGLKLTSIFLKEEIEIRHVRNSI